MDKIAPIYIVGYSLGFLFLGYVTLFYLVGTKFFKIWMPISHSYSDMLGTLMPFLYPLTFAATAAISEEFIFRLFAISFFKKYLKVTWLAVLIPSILWAFAHSSYPVYPNYVRGIELTMVGVVFSLVYLKYGIECTMIAHYVIDAFLVGWPLKSSDNFYFKSSGIVVLTLTVLPLFFIPYLSTRKNNTFKLPEIGGGGI